MQGPEHHREREFGQYGDRVPGKPILPPVSNPGSAQGHHCLFPPLRKGLTMVLLGYTISSHTHLVRTDLSHGSQVFPRLFEDSFEVITRLRQTGVLEEYIDKFETVTLRVYGMSDEQHLITFLIGLREDLEFEVHSFFPRTVEEAIELAQLQKVKLQALKRSIWSWDSRRKWDNTKGPATSATQGAGSATPKQFTPSQWHHHFEDWRGKGLCYRCE